MSSSSLLANKHPSGSPKIGVLLQCFSFFQARASSGSSRHKVLGLYVMHPENSPKLGGSSQLLSGEDHPHLDAVKGIIYAPFGRGTFHNPILDENVLTSSTNHLRVPSPGIPSSKEWGAPDPPTRGFAPGHLLFLNLLPVKLLVPRVDPSLEEHV